MRRDVVRTRPGIVERAIETGLGHGPLMRHQLAGFPIPTA
jgi:hypothetical protein